MTTQRFPVHVDDAALAVALRNRAESAPVLVQEVVDAWFAPFVKEAQAELGSRLLLAFEAADAGVQQTVLGLLGVSL